MVFPPPSRLARLLLLLVTGLTLVPAAACADTTEAEASLKRGRVDEATAMLKQVLKQDPHLAYAHQLLRVGGGERILWGSDWPFAGFEGRVTYEKVLAGYYDIVPDAGMRRAIDRTALRFYFG